MSDRLKRASGTKKTRRKFVIAMEGKVTEPGYFRRVYELAEKEHVFQLVPIPWNSTNDPAGLLESMRSKIKELNDDKDFKRNDEAWIVFDRDQWPVEQITAVTDWTNEDTRFHRFHAAISIPAFEYWLLLHFCDVKKHPTTADACRNSLKRHIPDYDKSIPPNKITIEGIKLAFDQAKARNKSSGSYTDVYKIVKSIFEWE